MTRTLVLSVQRTNGLDTVRIEVQVSQKPLLTYNSVAWDVTANFSFGRHYGFIDQEKDVDKLITDSTAGLVYFALVTKYDQSRTTLNMLMLIPGGLGLPNSLD